MEFDNHIITPRLFPKKPSVARYEGERRVNVNRTLGDIKKAREAWEKERRLLEGGKIEFGEHKWGGWVGRGGPGKGEKREIREWKPRRKKKQKRVKVHVRKDV